MWKLLILLVIVGVIVPCKSATNSSDFDVFKRWRSTVVSFTGKCLPALINSSKDGSVAASPVFPIYTLTQMAYKCKKGSQTCAELFKFLNMKNKDEIILLLKQFKSLLNLLPKDSELYFASNIVANIQYKFTDEFKQNMMIPTNTTKAFSVDFSKEKEATYVINSIVANETDNKVLNCIDTPNILNKKQQLNSISGIYLNTCFDKSGYKNISMCKYYSKPNRTSAAPFNCMSGTYNYTESKELNAKILKIPLKIRGFSAIIFLPNEKDGLVDLANKLSNSKDVENAYNNLKPAHINMCLPLFDNMKKVADLRDTLIKEAHVDSIFDQKKAQFKGMIENDKPVSLTLTHQKIILECNRTTDCHKSEETPDYSDCPEDLEEFEFLVDHPAVIYYTYKGVPIVCSIGKPLMFS